MIKRYTKSFFITFFLYGIFIAGFFLTIKKIDNSPLDNTIYISLLSENRPKESKATKEFPKFKKVPKKVPKKEKYIKREIKTQNKTVKKYYIAKPKKQQNEAKKPIISTKQTKVKDQKQQLLASANSVKNSFLARIKDAINANKYYPSLAKNREIEGKVHATFTINSDGSVSNIVILDGNMLLRDATRKAIEKSFPIDIPNEIKNSMPINENITLKYNLIK